MTATLFLPPVLAAAVVNGLVGVAVLDAVTCRCGGSGVRHPASNPETCLRCGGSGTVAPSVEPGQHLTIAATRGRPRTVPPVWLSGPDDYYVQLGENRVEPLRFGAVVGSAVATTPALPIVDGDPMDGECLFLDSNWDDSPMLIHLDADSETDLSAALPWLPSELVGRWAVLVEGASPALRPHTTHSEVCDCAPVPLPDGVDPEPYTLNPGVPT